MHFAGLYLPTSDLDVVVLDSREADLRAALRAVATGLLRKDLARNVQARNRTLHVLTPCLTLAGMQSRVGFVAPFEGSPELLRVLPDP